jgi:hypothetical protein
MPLALRLPTEGASRRLCLQYLRLLLTRKREAEPSRQALLEHLLQVARVAGQSATIAGQEMAQGLAGEASWLQQ